MRGATMIGFVPSVDLDTARVFYEDALGLTLASRDDFALEFTNGSETVRVIAVGELTPQPFTILGWATDDIHRDIERLANKGVVFVRYDHFGQDASGVWSSPSGALVAWFRDPDGNVLSLTQR
ncbi:MAG: VOC family protein [Actinomycetia bacterium]|nr:VOC family protein [Actinomycetes bacterium]